MLLLRVPRGRFFRLAFCCGRYSSWRCSRQHHLCPCFPLLVKKNGAQALRPGFPPQSNMALLLAAAALMPLASVYADGDGWTHGK